MAPFTFPTEGVEFAELLRRNEYVIIDLELRVQNNNRCRARTDLKPVPLVSEAPPNAAFPSIAICKLIPYIEQADISTKQLTILQSFLL
jgi:hypothetical protein